MKNNPFKRLPPSKKIPANKKDFFVPDSAIVIYTTLRLLNKMKRILGLEIMLEYIDYSIQALEKLNSDLRSNTTQVLEIIDVDKIYREVKQK